VTTTCQIECEKFDVLVREVSILLYNVGHYVESGQVLNCKDEDALSEYLRGLNNRAML